VNASADEVCHACHASLSAVSAPETLFNGRYRLLTQVGSGDDGAVDSAIDTQQNKLVAVKQISLQGLSDTERIEATDAFYREMQWLTELRHPNLPRIYETFTDRNHWYLVLDLIEGETLEYYLQSSPRSHGCPGLPLNTVLAIGQQLCVVLDYLHTRHSPVIFRDLKPDNIMRCPDGHLFLIDFGTACRFVPWKPLDTLSLGSPGYAAPEQYSRGQSTPQTDIYGLGALLHHLLTGKNPDETPFHFAPVRLSSLPEADLAALNTLILRMVETDAQRRPASIREVQNELQRLAAHCARREPLSQTEVPLSRTPPPIPQGGPGAQIPRRRVLQSLGVGTLVLAGVATVGGWAGLTSCTSAPHYHGVVPVGVTPIATPGADYIYRGHRAGVTTVAWSRDGRYFASGSADKTVQVWQATNGALRYTFVGHTSPVTALAWDVTSTSITSAGDEDGKVWVWNALRDEQKAGHMGQHGRVLSLAWPDPYDTTRTPPVNVILSGAEDGTVQVWDAESGKATTTYAGQGAVRALLSYSPDRVLLAGNDHIIHHWEIFAGGNTSLTPVTYEGHTGAINALAWIDENNTFASASDDGTVRVWSATSTQSSASPKLTYRGHTGSVYAVAVYKGLIISGGQDHAVQIWRFDTGKLLYTYTGHQGPIRSLSVVPPLNNATHMHTPVSFVASASDDGTVHVWHIPEKVLAAGRFP
jgi:WD40 repeat protein